MNHDLLNDDLKKIDFYNKVREFLSHSNIFDGAKTGRRYDVIKFNVMSDNFLRHNSDNRDDVINLLLFTESACW